MKINDMLTQKLWECFCQNSYEIAKMNWMIYYNQYIDSKLNCQNYTRAEDKQIFIDGRTIYLVSVPI